MTIYELHRQFKFELDKIDTQAIARFTPEEVDSLLNRAVMRFIKQRYNFNNLYKTAFEHTQKRVDDLRTLVEYRRTEDSELTLIGDEVVLPADYMFLLRLEVDTRDDCGEYTNVGYQVQTDDLNKLLKDPFNKPAVDKVLYVFRENRIKLFTVATVSNVRMTYLRLPIAISYSNKTLEYTELPIHAHDEIVTMAVSSALEFINNPRINTHPQEYNRTE